MRRWLFFLGLVGLLILALVSSPVFPGGLIFAQADTPTPDFRTFTLVGAIQPFAGAPPDPSTGWLVADGSCLSSLDYPQLYAVIGGFIGLDGEPCVTDGEPFRLPDLRGRVIMGSGAGIDLTARTIGDYLGDENHLLTILEMPAHTHPPLSPSTIFAQGGGTGNSGAFVAGSAYAQRATTGSTGGGQPHNIIQPSLVLNYLIWAGTDALEIASNIELTVVVVFPSHTPTPTETPTLTPTDGPSPTPTATITPTVNAEVGYQVGDQNVILRYEVTPGDAAIVGFLTFIAGLLIVFFVMWIRRRT